MYLGDIGCEKNCIFQSNGFLKCDVDSCKEGFYNLNGKCYVCSHASKNCIKCENAIIPGREKDGKILKCLQCNNTNDFISKYDGKCHTCNDIITNEWPGNCNKCHYENNNLVCEECINHNDYYINSYGKCLECYEYEFKGGICKKVCSDIPTKNNSEGCSCYTGFQQVKNDIQCISCGENCAECNLDDQNNATCTKCKNGYLLDNGTLTCYDSGK